MNDNDAAMILPFANYPLSYERLGLHCTPFLPCYR